MTDADGGPGRMSPEMRAQYRAFVRDHHPDRGGDPDFFVAGLARFRAGPAGSVPPVDDPRCDDPRCDDPRCDDPRWDSPVEIVSPLPLPARVVVAMIRTLRWHRQRRVE